MLLSVLEVVRHHLTPMPLVVAENILCLDHFHHHPNSFFLASLFFALPAFPFFSLPHFIFLFIFFYSWVEQPDKCHPLALVKFLLSSLFFCSYFICVQIFLLEHLRLIEIPNSVDTYLALQFCQRKRYTRINIRQTR